MEDRAASPSPAQLPHFCGDGFRFDSGSAIIISNFTSA
jgi:hypothetical protein